MCECKFSFVNKFSRVNNHFFVSRDRFHNLHYHDLNVTVSLSSFMASYHMKHIFSTPSPLTHRHFVVETSLWQPLH